jgi:hypothetical protein
MRRGRLEVWAAGGKGLPWARQAIIIHFILEYLLVITMTHYCIYTFSGITLLLFNIFKTHFL